MIARYVFLFLFACSLSALTHRPEPIIIGTPPAQQVVRGVIYNLDNFVNIAEYLGAHLDEYGANSTVDYLTPVFPHKITTFADALPQIVMNKNDVILIEVTVPDRQWQDGHSLFNITPYFYFYEENGQEISVYASENITIQFFELFHTPGDVIKICITPNKTIADQYESDGYMISGMPQEYLDQTTFQILFRVGTLFSQPQRSINDFVKVTFLKAMQESSFAGSDYFDAAEIIASFPAELTPDSPPGDLAEYQAIASYLQGEGFLVNQCVKYLSNIYGTMYAFNNFYKAITVSPAAQMQANNTGENYFNSPGYPVAADAFIDLNEVPGDYLYVLSLNQNTMGAGLTSNVQVYNSQSLAIIPDGLITTSPSIPPFSDPDYPYVVINTEPLFKITGYNVASLIAAGTEQVIVTERISYNPVNFYQSSNEYEGKAYVFYGEAFTLSQEMTLLTDYGITVNYIPPLSP